MGFLSVYRSSVALFFPVLEQQIDNLLFFVFLQSKDRTGGSRPARRLTFVQAATKVSKNALAPSGGHIPLHGFGAFYEQLNMGSGPVQKGLSPVLSCSNKLNHTLKPRQKTTPETSFPCTTAH
jgi:hypothetical protein